jgi:chemotaxis protein MotB
MKSLAPYLNSVPNHISLAGHTDTTPYVVAGGYNNWDLSTDRANAARRALESGGLNSDKISRVVGLSSSVLFDKDNTRDPINRRISIIVMTQEAEENALKTDTATEIPASAAAQVLHRDGYPEPPATPPAAGSVPEAQGAGKSGALPVIEVPDATTSPGVTVKPAAPATATPAPAPAPAG